MENLSDLMQKQLELMQQTGRLFRSNVSGDIIWELYLKGFNNDPVFRDPYSSTHNCNHCNNFLRRYGSIVSINENLEIITLFDFDLPEDDEYFNSIKNLRETLKAAPILGVFNESFESLNSLPYESCKRNQSVFQLGVPENHKIYSKEEVDKYPGRVIEGKVYKFTHANLKLSKSFVLNDKSSESVNSEFIGKFQVMKRGLDELNLDTLYLVRDLINQGSLMNSTTYLPKLLEFIKIKEEYDKLPNKSKDNFIWISSYDTKTRFKNELIGVLCTELSEGKDLNKACEDWNKRVDPANWMKAVAPITKSQIDKANKLVDSLGYGDSFNRRVAVLDDIDPSLILHQNVGDSKVPKVSIFDGLKSTTTSSRHKRAEFDKVEEVSIDKFMKDILPGLTKLEVFLDPSLSQNLVTMTTSVDKSSKSLFPYGNNFSWTYNGNLAGKSLIKQAIKSRGGNTEGVLNIRLAFPGTSDDYDLHVVEPNHNRIYYANVRSTHPSSGTLDLDANGVDGAQPPEKRVENVIYTDQSRMLRGDYIVIVKNYSKRGFRHPFFIEVEFNGETYSYEHSDPKSNEIVALVINYDGINFNITNNNIKEVSSSSSIKELYGLEVNQFHKVNLMCLSPNHWNGQYGNLHYFFMLEGCKNPNKIRTFHSENLNQDLHPERKVLDYLANTLLVEGGDDQLSGVGFNSTMKEEVIVKLHGTHKRVIKIKF
jgi:hypothetical protein